MCCGSLEQADRGNSCGMVVWSKEMERNTLGCSNMEETASASALHRNWYTGLKKLLDPKQLGEGKRSGPSLPTNLLSSMEGLRIVREVEA